MHQKSNGNTYPCDLWKGWMYTKWSLTKNVTIGCGNYAVFGKTIEVRLVKLCTRVVPNMDIAEKEDLKVMFRVMKYISETKIIVLNFKHQQQMTHHGSWTVTMIVIGKVIQRIEEVSQYVLYS